MDPRALQRVSWRSLLKEGRLSVNALKWESAWSSPDYSPVWLAESVPAEIQEAASEWFVPGSRLLDIGCGDGRIAAWLAKQGYQVTGVDVAPSAIKAAKETHGGEPGLSFEVADITRPLPHSGFDALLDRGCFHLLRKKDQVAYVANVGAAASPNARFLLLHFIAPEATVESVIHDVTELCGVSFSIERTAEVVMAHFAGGERRGVAFWMSKR